MSVWYAILNALGLPMFEMDFMKNALLAVLLMAPLFGLLSTMIVTGRMSFFSDALGHSGFTGIAIGALCGAVQPIYFAVGLSVLFALLFSFVRSRTSQSADTIIGVFSSTAVALGIFIVTLGMTDRDIVLRLIDKIGPDRLIFGTDFPMWSPKEELARFLALDLDESSRQKILYENFMKLLKLHDEDEESTKRGDAHVSDRH